MNFQVKWHPEIMDEYQYGTTLKYHKDGSVNFKNNLIPPGMRIVKWISNPDFQANRTLLQLPLLKRNQQYRLTTRIKSTPENKFFIMIRFFDRKDSQVGMTVIKELEAIFTYPDNAYAYSLEVINKGATNLKYTEIIIDDEFETK